MDPLKRELYMRARTILEHGMESCVCWALVEALRELGISYCKSIIDPALDLEELIQDIFPEFFGLDDLTKWYNDSGMIYAIPRPEGTATYWWDIADTAPRLRILDCILNSY